MRVGQSVDKLKQMGQIAATLLTDNIHHLTIQCGACYLKLQFHHTVPFPLVCPCFTILSRFFVELELLVTFSGIWRTYKHLFQSHIFKVMFL
jgi:hypothetical protein